MMNKVRSKTSGKRGMWQSSLLVSVQMVVYVFVLAIVKPVHVVSSHHKKRGEFNMYTIAHRSLLGLLSAAALNLIPAFGLTMLPAASVLADSLQANIMAEPSTGSNRFLGEPQWILGAPWGTSGDTSVGGFNPNGGDEPFELTHDTPLDTILASFVDDAVLENFGISRDDIDVPLNTPLHENFTVVDTDGTRGQLPPATEVPGYELSKSLPNDPITLKQWLAARGWAQLRCKKDGSAKVRMSFKGLIVNGLYSVWATYGDPNDGLFSVPLGGTPNVFVAGKDGKAQFTRSLNGCPLEVYLDEPTLLFIEIAYHSDGMVQGAMPDLPNAGFPFGVTTHTQLGFPVNVEGPF